MITTLGRLQAYTRARALVYHRASLADNIVAVGMSLRKFNVNIFALARDYYTRPVFSLVSSLLSCRAISQATCRKIDSLLISRQQRWLGKEIQRESEEGKSPEVFRHD